MDRPSPLKNIFSIIRGLPQGHDKLVKQALYNAVAVFLVFLCCAAGWALYFILEPFIKPLVWALLVGSVLHPFKHSLRVHMQMWFRDIEVSGTPFVIGICMLPLRIVNNISELVGNILLKYMKIIGIILAVVSVLHISYYYTPVLVKSTLWTGVAWLCTFTSFFVNNVNISLVILLITIYVTTLSVAWRPENNRKFHLISIGMWCVLSCCLAQQFGSFRNLIFVALQLMFVGGFFTEIRKLQKDAELSGHSLTLLESVQLLFNVSTTEVIKEVSSEKKENMLTKEDENFASFESSVQVKHPNPWSLDLFEDSKKSKSNLLLNKKQTDHIMSQKEDKKTECKITRSISQPQIHTAQYSYQTKKPIESHTQNIWPETLEGEHNVSTFYLYTLIWACVTMLFWKNLVLLPILPILLLIYLIKHVSVYFGVWSLLFSYYVGLREQMYHWCSQRVDALVPLPVRGLCRISVSINDSLKNSVNNSIDSLASCIVIFGLLMFVMCTSIFFIFQIYTEAIMLVQMFSNVINQTVVNNPELKHLLPDTWDDTVDSILDNAYQYGREGISKAVKSITINVDSNKSLVLEKQVLELWDRVYQAWMSSDDQHGPKVTQAAVKSSWNAFLNDIKKSPDIFNLNSLTNFLRQNVDTLFSLVESVWTIVKGNVSLVIGFSSTFLSVVLGGGTAVFNFILNVIVFLTTLFYLLSSSGDFYKPVEVIMKFSSGGSWFGLALENAINGVFRASFKMAMFYGLWTWLIHNLFGLKIVYLPSAFATVFGAVPFLGPYWACLPGVLDLWLSKNEGVLAILFAVFHLLPTSVVDTTIYKEIKGGHPYLTGLSIAGGIFCLGIEGAIIGPLLLCALYVAMHLSSTLFTDTQ